MPRRHRFRGWHSVVGCAAVPAVCLAGCSFSTDSSTPPSLTSATAPTGPNDLDATLPTPGAYPTDDDGSRAAAEAVAGATMSSFIRADLTAEDWLDQLSANLTAEAIAAYYDTDPLQVPARALTGSPRWSGSTSAYLADVVVPTDVGDYRLLLVRDGQGAPWLVQTISPPDGLP